MLLTASVDLAIHIVLVFCCPDPIHKCTALFDKKSVHRT